MTSVAKPSLKVFCPLCGKKTEQSYVFNMYATECAVCHSMVSCMDKLASESKV